MKNFIPFFTVAACLVGNVAAFPVAEDQASIQDAFRLNPANFANITREDVLANIEKARSMLKLQKRQVTFDAQAQYVPTTGQYAFRAPGPGDQRGNCPGLNGRLLQTNLR